MYMFVHGYVMIYPDVDIDIRFPPASNLPSCDPGAVVPRTSITSDIYIYIIIYVCVFHMILLIQVHLDTLGLLNSLTLKIASVRNSS